MARPAGCSGEVVSGRREKRQDFLGLAVEQEDTRKVQDSSPSLGLSTKRRGLQGVMGNRRSRQQGEEDKELSFEQLRAGGWIQECGVQGGGGAPESLSQTVSQSRLGELSGSKCRQGRQAGREEAKEKSAKESEKKRPVRRESRQKRGVLEAERRDISWTKRR